MTAITRIEIRNFQSHRHTVIETAPAGGLTVIVGPSDSGKTAILRSLKWLLYNLPEGSDFRRVGCDLVEVTVETPDGHTVTRSRTQTTNRYVVDGVKLEGFGRTVPAEVQQVTGVFPIRLGDQEILANLAGQLEAPFLGSSLSGPARAKALGKLAGIEVIDRALRDLAGDVQRMRLEKSRLESELQRLDGEIARYSHLPALAARIEQLKSIAARIEAAYERWKALSEVRQQVQALNAQIQDAERRLGAVGDVDGAQRTLEQVRTAVDRRARLAELWHTLSQVTDAIRASASTLNCLQGVDQATTLVSAIEQGIARLTILRAIHADLGAARQTEAMAEERIREADRILALSPRLDGVAGKVERRTTLVLLHKELATHTNTVINAQRMIDATGEQLTDATRAYTAALIEGGTCPTCGQVIDESIHSHVQEVLAS